MIDEIDEATLLAECETRGRPVSRAQLKHWRRAGLLQRARQEHPPGRRGSVSWSPATAVDQVLLISELLDGGRRSTDWVLVQLWWRGKWVDRAALRNHLIEELEAVSREAREVAAAHDDPADAADAAVRAMRWRNLSPINETMLMRLGGRRRGRRPLEEFLWFCFFLGFGGSYEPPPERDEAPSLEEVAARATGVEQAKNDVRAVGGPWLPGETTALGVVDDLRRAGALNMLDLAASIRGATDLDLDRARDDARMVAGDLATIAAAIQLMLGDDVAGIGSISAMARTVENDPGLLIFAFLVLRKALGDRPFEAIHALAQDEAPRFRAIVELITAIPDAARLLDDHLGGEPRSKIADDVAVFFEERPELLQAIEGPEAPFVGLG